MPNKQELLAKLRIARETKGLSYQDIVDITEANGEPISMSTIRRIFAPGANLEDFRYNSTVRPVVRAVLGMDEEIDMPPASDPRAEEVATIEALKALADYKSDMLQTREAEHQRVVEFLKNTVEQQRKDLAWYRKVVVVLGCISLFALCMVIADLAIGTIGWIRY